MGVEEDIARDIAYATDLAAKATMNLPKRTLKKGDRGDDVKILQAILGITVDGNFGPATDSAVRNWQSAHGIEVDGVVGPLTWTSLSTHPNAIKVLSEGTPKLSTSDAKKAASLAEKALKTTAVKASMSSWFKQKSLISGSPNWATLVGIGAVLGYAYYDSKK
jgi:peptidoglycan hydrolase-like protein with peptidoglycan-binding domain